MSTERDIRFEESVAKARLQGQITVPNLIGGEWSEVGPLTQREDPSHPGLLVSASYNAPAEVMAEALEAARKASRAWTDLGPAGRADALWPLLDALDEDRRTQMATYIAIETGKARSDCYSEPDELAILVERYGATARDETWWEEPLDQLNPSAVSRSILRPFGVFGVISPFNFPMVLGAGPIVAALLAGNTVVWKPSRLAPRSAHAFAEVMSSIGLPAGVFNMVFADNEAGSVLIDGADGIAFTGSEATGLAIRDRIAAGPYPRPLIAELGGKNPVIVTDSADVELAAQGIAVSAFGVSGQKCSCASAVFATPGVYGDLVARLGEIAAETKFGDPIDPTSFAGPVITAKDITRFESLVEEAKADGRVVAGGNRVEEGGQFAQPTVVADLPFGHPLTRNEHFLPFVTVTQVDDFVAALAAANDTQYGLTAGIYTGKQVEADDFLAGMHAGCINVNKPGHATTGWWPGNQNFGGWKASGLGSKLAFGNWYVQQFAREQSRTIGVVGN